jgi:hypothetical protein
MSLPELVRAMEEPATEDLRAVKLLPILLKAIGHPKNADLAQALQTLRQWRTHGGHRRDLDDDGSFEHTDAIQIMDAWWPLLVKAEFRPSLGNDAFDRVRGMLGVGDHTRGAPNAPDFFGGWWGYASKDLRTLFGDTPAGAYSRVYCGKGSKSKCRKALRSSLSAALHVSAGDLYGGGDCSGDPDPECYDRNRATHTSGISIPEMPFQNRPTFQQAVAVKQDFH